MKPQFFIRWSIVRHDVRVGGQCAEESMMIVVGYVLVDELHCYGDFGTISIEFHVVQFQIKYIPLSTINGFMTYTIFGFYI